MNDGTLAMRAAAELARFPWLVVGMLSASVRSALVERRMHEDARELFALIALPVIEGLTGVEPVEKADGPPR